jgi:Intracellular proteinase inhibitor
MTVSFLAGSAALALAGSACHASPARGAAAAADGGVAVADAGPDSLRLELVAPARVRAGEAVPIRLRARNVTEKPLDLYLRGRSPTLDVIVARPSGDVVWRRLEGEIIPAIVHLRPLAPGEQLEIAASWNQRTNAGRPVDPGEYVVTGLLLVEGEPLRAPSRPLSIVR